MPASGAQEVRRGRLLQGFFWGGVGLATLAMLVLLFSQSVVVLRVAVILCVIAIMMLAISIVLRPSVEMIRVDIEEHIIGEVERVRLRARDDISTAARNTHRVLSEKIYALTATVEALRGQIEELRVSSMLAAAAPSPQLGQPPAAAGVVHRTETVQVTRRTTTVDPGDDATRGTVYGSRSAVDGEWSEERGEDPGTRPRASASSEPRNEYGEADWEATFRSLSRQPSALPASPGRPASWYTDDRGEEEWTRSRGRDRESRPDRESRHDRDREPRHDHDREHGRHADREDGRYADREDGRYADREDGRYADREAEYGRHSERRRDRDHERDRPYGRDGDHRDSGHDRYRGHEPDRYRDLGRDRDREYERERERDHDRGYGRPRERDRRYEDDRRYDGDRGYDGDGDRPFPRPRSPHPAERQP